MNHDLDPLPRSFNGTKADKTTQGSTAYYLPNTPINLIKRSDRCNSYHANLECRHKISSVLDSPLPTPQSTSLFSPSLSSRPCERDFQYQLGFMPHCFGSRHSQSLELMRRLTRLSNELCSDWCEVQSAIIGLVESTMYINR